MYLQSRTFWRRAMETGALASWPGVAVAAPEVMPVPAGASAAWGWTLFGGVLVGGAVACWRTLRWRRREARADRH